MTAITGTDPRTAGPLEPTAQASSTDHVAELAGRAAHDAFALENLGRERRADLLDAMAAAVERRRDDVIEIASRETGFADAKLNGELTRAVFQLRFFAAVLREGSYLEAIIDRAGDTPMGPRPDLRRLLVPIGPVAVFGASNFPFAFSVLGGDTASALAAGCPVILKAHDSHPGTSKLSYDILSEAAEAFGAPSGTLGIVYGLQGGADLVAHSAIRAVGFTGSLNGGQALLDIVNGRDEPIPFYGELSSINPVIVTPAAASERAEQIGRDLVASFTTGAGQLCTKPGVVLVPRSADGDRLVDAATAALTETAPQLLLNERIYSSYTAETAQLRQRCQVATFDAAASAPASGFYVDAALFEVDLAHLDGDLVREIFGPVSVIVRYDAEQVVDQVASALHRLPRSLTATVHHGSTADEDLTGRLTAVVRETAGRILYNGFPTGVAVSWAQNHGGPWPSTNSLHTSVGATAIRRFLRPLTFQNAPESVLPQELRSDFERIPRRIGGVLTLPSADTGTSAPASATR
jgi:NADP-dependent aldehyde dehydrogenase